MNRIRNLFVGAACCAAGFSWAHPGHGMPGPVHWHATDVAGLAVVAGFALLALWLGRGE